MYSFPICNNKETTYIHVLGNSHLMNIMMMISICKVNQDKSCCYNFNTKIRWYSAHKLQ